MCSGKDRGQRQGYHVPTETEMYKEWPMLTSEEVASVEDKVMVQMSIEDLELGLMSVIQSVVMFIMVSL